MTLDHLWSGWRATYVEGVVENEPIMEPHECVLCRLVEGIEEAHVVTRPDLVCVVMNGFPYTSGHVMVLPNRHVADLEDLEPAEFDALFQAVRNAIIAVKGAYNPDGVNVGMNLGRAAGAGVPGHLHWHVLPRWSGDGNFMLTVAEARVMPEPLSFSAEKLRAAWPQDNA